MSDLPVATKEALAAREAAKAAKVAEEGVGVVKEEAQAENSEPLVELARPTGEETRRIAMGADDTLSLIHISEPTRLDVI
eukprot:5809474-Prorocentrum_lima.AAC.1